MTAAAIQAEYADYKRIKGRKVLQIICEVPIEQAPEIHKLLGEPAFGEKQINVAIAKLDMAAVKENEDKPQDKSYAQQAALVCAEPLFWRYLEFEGVSPSLRYDDPAVSAEGAADAVRKWCEVKSRADLLEGTPGGENWVQLHGKYLAWKIAG